MTLHSIDQGRGAVAVRQSGHGETVVLLHSSACSSAQWRRFQDELQGRYRVLAPDLYGYGGTSAWSGPGPLRLADEARLVWDLVRREQGPVHLVGHSYGGAVALRLALDHGAQLQSLTLIEPVAFHLLRGKDPTLTRFFEEVRGLAEHVWRGVAEGDPEAAMARFVEYWNGPGAWDQLSAAQRDGVARTAGKVAMDFFSAMTDTRGLEAYRSIQVPSLILVGDRSPTPVRYIAGLLGGVLPWAGMRHLAGLGHMMPLSHPGIVNPIIARHIETNSGQDRRAA